MTEEEMFWASYDDETEPPEADIEPVLERNERYRAEVDEDLREHGMAGL